MSLHVNLILDSERRSGSNVSKKFIIYIVAAVVPIIIGLVFLSLFFVSKQAQNRKESLETSWSNMDAAQKLVQNIQQNLTSCKAVAGDITGWRDSRVDLSALLMAIADVVPETIQITRMTMSDPIGPVSGARGRAGTIFIRGRVTGGHPHQNVIAMEQALAELEVIQSAKVMRYAAEGEDPSKTGGIYYNVFDMECLLEPRIVR